MYYDVTNVYEQDKLYVQFLWFYAELIYGVKK